MKQIVKKKVNRYFNVVPKTRLIVSVEQSIVDEIDELIKHADNHLASKNRSEFVRMVIIDKLGKDKRILNFEEERWNNWKKQQSKKIFY